MRRAVSLGLMLAALLGASYVLARPASAQTAPRSVLVVGDSVVAQASRAILHWAPPGSTVWSDGAMGTAPCDWWDGYRNPSSGLHLSFARVVQQYRPAAVVLAFSGNPGLSGRAGGCVDANTHYPLRALVDSYRHEMTAMANDAVLSGARVYLAATPPRNPATPSGAYTASGGLHGYGFNGVTDLNQLYQEMSSSPEGLREGWQYDPAAAAAVSDLSLSWHLRLTCMPWDLPSNCRLPSADVQVRAGGLDAIHLDPWGNGATRYGMAITRRPLEDQTARP